MILKCNMNSNLYLKLIFYSTDDDILLPYFLQIILDYLSCQVFLSKRRGSYIVAAGNGGLLICLTVFFFPSAKGQI